MLVFLLGCVGKDRPLDPQDVRDLLEGLRLLNTETHLEPDRSWDRGISARDISWNYISSTQMKNYISVVGAFKITFLNSDPDLDVVTDASISFTAIDGSRHFAQTPFSRVSIPHDDSTLVRENFILDVKDASTANGITRMNISVF